MAHGQPGPRPEAMRQVPPAARLLVVREETTRWEFRCSYPVDTPGLSGIKPVPDALALNRVFRSSQGLRTVSGEPVQDRAELPLHLMVAALSLHCLHDGPQLIGCV